MSDIWNIESLYKLSYKNCFCLQLLLEELQTRYFTRAVLAEVVYEFEEKNVQEKNVQLEKNMQEKNVQERRALKQCQYLPQKNWLGVEKMYIF